MCRTLCNYKMSCFVFSCCSLLVGYSLDLLHRVQPLLRSHQLCPPALQLGVERRLAGGDAIDAVPCGQYLRLYRGQRASHDRLHRGHVQRTGQGLLAQLLRYFGSAVWPDLLLKSINDISRQNVLKVVKKNHLVPRT